MDEDKTMKSEEVLIMVDMFDCLDGRRQLDLLGIFIGKLENGEIELNGNQITSEEIGIDDSYTCCATIQKLLSVEHKLSMNKTE